MKMAVDWNMVAFVALTMVNEYLVQVHYPRVYYWNGKRDSDRKRPPFRPPGGK